MVALCSWKQTCVKKCCRRCPSDGICWNNLIIFFFFSFLCGWGDCTCIPEVVLPSSPKDPRLQWLLQGLLFSPPHLNGSELGLGSMASLKWCYLSCAQSDWDAASVMLRPCVQWWTSEEDGEYSLLWASRRISSAWRVWHRSTSLRRGDSEHVDWASEIGKLAFPLCVDEEEEIWISSSLCVLIFILSHLAWGFLTSAPVHETSDWDTLLYWNVRH